MLFIDWSLNHISKEKDKIHVIHNRKNNVTQIALRYRDIHFFGAMHNDEIFTMYTFIFLQPITTPFFVMDCNVV